MATRLYFDSTTVPAVSPLIASAEWEHVGVHVIRSLTVPHVFSTMATFAVTYDSVEHFVNQDALIAQYVSLPLIAQNIAAQTVKLTIRCAEVRAGNDLFLTWKLFLIDSTGAVVPSGTILPIRRDGLETATSLTSRTDSTTTTNVTAPVNSRIVLEIGLGGLPAGPVGGTVEGHNGSIRVGDEQAADLLENDTTTTERNPWLEFTNTLTFAPPVLPAVRVSQDSLEVLWTDAITGDARATQDSLEALYGQTAEVFTTQDSLEVLYGEEPITTPFIHVTMDSLEILWEEPAPPAPAVLYTHPEGQVNTTWMVAGSVQFAHMEAGQVTTARTVAGQVNFD